MPVHKTRHADDRDGDDGADGLKRRSRANTGILMAAVRPAHNLQSYDTHIMPVRISTNHVMAVALNTCLFATMNQMMIMMMMMGMGLVHWSLPWLHSDGQTKTTKHEENERSV